MRAAGIDVGKANLDLAVDGEAGVVRFANNRAGITKLVKRLLAMGAERIVVEATGGYEEPLLEACCDAGLWIARVNPRQARDFARATGELAKTDAIDARLLPLMARMFEDRLRRHDAPPPWQCELRDWLRRRGQVVVLIQAQKQQAAMAPAAVRKLVARTTAALTRELAAIEREMKARSRNMFRRRCAQAKALGPSFTPPCPRCCRSSGISTAGRSRSSQASRR
jgi:transposase